jgi:hypothetical protein
MDPIEEKINEAAQKFMDEFFAEPSGVWNHLTMKTFFKRVLYKGALIQAYHDEGKVE